MASSTYSFGKNLVLVMNVLVICNESFAVGTFKRHICGLRMLVESSPDSTASNGDCQQILLVFDEILKHHSFLVSSDLCRPVNSSVTASC